MSKPDTTFQTEAVAREGEGKVPPSSAGRVEPGAVPAHQAPAEDFDFTGLVEIEAFINMGEALFARHERRQTA